MPYLSLDSTTRIFFENKIPTCVSWSLHNLREWPSNQELVSEAVDKLKLCGWKVKISQVGFDSDGPYSDLTGIINILE